MNLNPGLEKLIRDELVTDLPFGDATSQLLGASGDGPAQAVVSAKQSGVFCGEAVVHVFQSLFNHEYQTPIEFQCLVKDGQKVSVGDRLVEVKGPVRTCLEMERTLLNLLSHMSGIATTTRSFVDALGNASTKILATRKTLPGLRLVQLMGVQAGGGYIHRRSLSDGILIKDNHQQIVSANELVERAKLSRSPLHGIELEVQSLEELELALKNPPDVIMLDNMDVPMMKTAIQRIQRRSRVEVSGGIRLENIAEIAALGVDYISVGALTHSVKALDLTLDIKKGW